MRFLLKKRSIIICSVLIFMIITPFAIYKVEALYGGGVGLTLNPSSGVTGTVVQVSLDIPSWLKTQGTYESPSSYYNTEFSLFWDIGGWGYIPVPADLQNLARTKIPIGTAQVDSRGLLTGKVTIPPSDVGDEHVLFAIPKNLDLMETLSHFWGFFHVTGTGNAPSHPDFVTLTIPKNGSYMGGGQPGNPERRFWDLNMFTLELNNEEIDTSHEYSVQWPYDSKVAFGFWGFTGGYAGYGASDYLGWKTLDSSGNINTYSNDSFTILMNDDIQVLPWMKEVPSYTPRPTERPSDIPGFPLESILIGLLLAIGLLYMSKRKLTTKTPFPI